MKNENDGKFWKILAKMGYITSPAGVYYGSEKHKEYRELHNLLALEKERMQKGNLGWPAAMFYSKYVNNYYEAHIAFCAIYMGEMDIMESVIEGMKRDINYLENTLKYYLNRLDELRDWIRQGGKIDAVTVLHKFNVYENDDEYLGALTYARRYVENHFGNKRKMRIAVLISEFEDDKANDAIRIFNEYRDEAFSVVKDFEKSIVEICSYADIDPRELILRI